MNILHYLKGLLPSFKKDKIVESCEIIGNSIREHTLPAYVSAESLFEGRKFSSQEAKDFAAVYDKKIGRVHGKNMIGSIREGLENTLVLLQKISSDANHLFAETETNLSITYGKATCLRLIDAADYVNEFSRKLLNYMFVLETANADEHVSVKDSISDAEIKMLNDGFFDFCLCMQILKRDVKDIEKVIKDIPDAIITPMTEKTLPATIGRDKIDPFLLTNLSVKINPIYKIGMMVAERQANKYKCAKAELELLQLRKLNLEKLYEKTHDAKLQKEIEYMENRVTSLNYAVAKMEKEYNNE